MMSS
ncbi:hypothetical protein ZEAMMB73_Zm00001d017843 [Zea mays]|jgi:hypothetical protein